MSRWSETTAGEREAQYIHNLSRSGKSHKTIVIGTIKLGPNPNYILNNQNKGRGGQIDYYWSNSALNGEIGTQS